MTGLTRLSSSRLAERKTAWLWDWAPPPAGRPAPARGRDLTGPH
jgi:hypothetical protein